jgi:hypothetical protein
MPTGMPFSIFFAEIVLMETSLTKQKIHIKE